MIKNTENLAMRVGYICDKIVSNLMYIRSSSTSLYTGFHGMIKNKIRSFQNMRSKLVNGIYTKLTSI